MARTLTITFRGLCMFAQSPTEAMFHVFLAQPLGMEHRTIRCYERSDKTYTGEEVAPGSSFEYGIAGSQASVLMPGTDEMMNVSDMPISDDLSENDARPTRFDERGSHVILHGGKLTPIFQVGEWKVDGDSGATYSFPYIVQWTGDVEETDQSGLMEFWNAMSDETPDPGRNAVVPDPKITQREAEQRAAMHFKSYLKIAGGKHRTIKFVQSRQAHEPKGPPRPVNANIRVASPTARETIIVSSCPSAAITLVSSATSENVSTAQTNGKSATRAVEAV